MRSNLNEKSLFFQDILEKIFINFSKELDGFKSIDKKRILINARKSLTNSLEKIILPTFALYFHELNNNHKIKGDTPSEKYRFFIKNYHRKFIYKFPEIEKFVNVYSYGFLNNIRTGLKTFTKYEKVIRKQFNLDNQKLTAISIPGNGDRHHNGKQVCFFNFNNKIIKYKPVNLDLNPLIEDIAGFINKKIGRNIFTFPQGIYLKNSSFLEFIISNQKIHRNETNKICNILGNWLAFIYLLNGTDFHVENVLAKNSHLYLLDTESFFSNFSYGSGRFFENQLISTGFVERITKSKSPTSGMFGGKKKYLSILDPYIQNPYSDKLLVKFVKKSNFKPFNNFKVDGRYYINFRNHKSAIINGFKEVYNIFYQYQDEIYSMVRDYNTKHKIYARQVLRKTSLYSLLIQNIYQPSNWPIGKFRKFTTDFLKDLNPDLSSLVDWEVDDIFNLNVPYFKIRLDSKSVFYKNKGIKNFFKQTSLERLERKFSSLGERHLNKKVQELEKLINQS